MDNEPAYRIVAVPTKDGVYLHVPVPFGLSDEDAVKAAEARAGWRDKTYAEVAHERFVQRVLIAPVVQ